MSTPQYDTSAMDGYAVDSSQTFDASPTRPLLFEVRGTMAAGDAPISVNRKGFACVEIMTGAQFPIGFDAVIPIEHTTRKDGKVYIRQPALRNQHRRFAGNDFAEGDKILSKGSVVRAKHVMALASVGIVEIRVLKIRVGIWSTGLEIANGMIPDVNGPYLFSALREIGVDVKFLGIIPDDAEALARAIQGANFDLLLTTGAVSVGKFDFVRTSMDILNADVIFHHVAMRPGHPVLCASIGHRTFFGLPGNPIATAACFQFLVLPFITGCIPSIKAEISIPIATGTLDMFRHGKISDGKAVINQQQSPAKVKPFSQSNCWVHVKGNLKIGDSVDCYSL
jgi:molybdopterin molybdotransferase